MNPPDTNGSSVTARLANARLKQWHQQGEALLTIENARSFLNATGLVLFAPRPQIAAPAPSFVEAVLGQPNAAPALAQIASARELLARLVAEGLAVPLNFLGIGSVVGQPGDAPDFIASTQVFSYVFTLRGDKAWKQPPQLSGAGKFSNLAIAAHEALTQRGPMTAYELTGELGKEVTESAVLRALGELWSHLRVLPLPQLDSGATVWELAAARLSKQVKAGANAGLPTALSALISLYLSQAIVATEDEVESFLSPLAARSRVREVLHALISARQLETVAIEGKTMLHVAGAAPAFLTDGPTIAADAADVADGPALSATADADAASVKGEEHGEIKLLEPGSRIGRFVPRHKPSTRELSKAKPSKFARKPFGEPRKPFGENRPFASRGGKERSFSRDSKSERPFQERRGFKRTSETGEERAPRGERRPNFRDEGKPPFEKKRFVPRDGEFKPRFDKRERGGERPARRPFVRREGSEERPQRRSGDRRPARSPFDRADGGERRPRRPFDRSAERPAGRKPFGGPKRFDREREGAPREERPAREFRPKPFGRRNESGEGEQRRSRGGGGKKPFVRSDRSGARPFRDRERGEGRPAGFGGKKPGGARFGDGGRFGDKKFGGGRPGGDKFGGKKFGGSASGGKKSFGKPKGRPKRPQGDEEA